MSETESAVEEAVARHLEFMELGGTKPDLSHLTEEAQLRVAEILGMLELTEGVALQGPGETEAPTTGRTLMQLAADSEPGPGRTLLEELGHWLPVNSPVDVDHTPDGFRMPGLPLAGSWTIGTPGGRVKLWLVDIAGAEELERDLSHLSGLERVFRAFPETAGIGLVCRDHSCILLEPQDCAPVIEVPTGSIASRRYRRPIQAVGEALSAFIRDLIPEWETLPRFEPRTVQATDVAALAIHSAEAAVGIQKELGSRARYPKKEVLSSLGERETKAVARMAVALYEGRTSPLEIEAELRKLAGSP